MAVIVGYCLCWNHLWLVDMILLYHFLQRSAACGRVEKKKDIVQWSQVNILIAGYAACFKYFCGGIHKAMLPCLISYWVK